MAPKILIIEDDKNIAKLVKYNLEKEGYECTHKVTGEDALKALDSEPFDLILLDIMLPKMSGFETCKEIKRTENVANTPIIIMTAKGEEVDKVVGFELGADDYIVKPFSVRELTLRIKAILKRGRPQEASKELLSAEKLNIDTVKHKVTVDKREVDLTLMEFRLLETLLRRRGRVQSRDRLLDDVWGISSEVTTRTIDTHIKRLRQKLGKTGKLIETVRGIGYRFKEESY